MNNKGEQLKVLQINTYEVGGGAEKMAFDLYRHCRDELLLQSAFLVGRKRSDNSSVIAMDQRRFRAPITRAWLTMGELLKKGSADYYGPWLRKNPVNRWAQSKRLHALANGYEDFDFPAIRHLEEQVGFKPDVINLHNLHGDYFDLSFLPELSRRYPVVLTLQDMWTFTGHCGYALGCDRWANGCGQCPRLDLYPSLQADGTKENLKRKAEIYAASHLYATVPSRWFKQLALSSVIEPAIQKIELIPNSVDTKQFYPMSKKALREAMEIPADALVLLFAAWGVNENPYKDYQTIKKAIEIIGQKELSRPVVLLALGSSAAGSEACGHAEVRMLPYQSEAKSLAEIYNTADIYLHAANAENFPLSVLEAMACALPVVVTDVGGVPEQVLGWDAGANAKNMSPEDEATGIVCNYQDAEDMARQVLQLAERQDLMRAMGQRALEKVQEQYSLDVVAHSFVDYYQAVINDHREQFG